MKLRWTLAILLLCACSVVPAFAQSPVLDPRYGGLGVDDLGSAAMASGRTSRTVAIAQPGAVDAETYRLGPGDAIALRLWGRMARTTTIDVDAEGLLQIPDLEPLQVSGQTLSQVRRTVKARLAGLYRDVRADLSIARMRTFKVYVTGEVKQPGAYEVTPVTRASEVLAQAQLLDRGSRRNIAVARRSGSLRADVQLFEAAGDLSGNPLLEDGDLLSVPVATQFVNASGAFARPMRFELAPSDSLSTLVRLAGGALPSADPAHALLVRFRDVSHAVSTLVNLGPGGADPALRDGDAVFLYYVPDFHRLHSVSVVGEVERPGAFPILIGRDRLSDVVRAAGGFRPRADVASLLVVRAPRVPAENDGEFERLLRLSREQMTESEYSRLQTELAQRKNSFRVDWRRLQAEGSRRDLDLLMADGDLVRVEPLVTSIRVDGQVRNPGMIEYVAGRSPEDYVRIAGGYTSRAGRGGTRVTRGGSGQVVPARSVHDLQPGDIIWVPEGRDRDYWSIFREVLAVAGQIAVVVVAVRR